jgi:tetratricopeptide (TPR) repeat protein
VTHGPIGTLNAVTGTVGLVAMLWLYGVAWHQPMGESLSLARETVAAALPSSSSLAPSRLIDPDFWHRGRAPDAAAPAAPTAGAPASAPAPAPAPVGNPGLDVPIDPEIAALFAARNKRIATLSAEGPRLLDAHQYRRAAESCRAWVDLELGNASAWRCLGLALQAQGEHREAVAAFRKAKQYDPGDGTIDALIARSQRGIVADFMSRRGR